MSRVGLWILMLGFGASFGWTVQGRIALAIGRAQDIRGTLRGPEDAARVHGEAAALASIAIVGAGIYLWERRRRRAVAREGEPPPPAPNSDAGSSAGGGGGASGGDPARGGPESRRRAGTGGRASAS